MDQILLDQANEYGFDAKLSNEEKLIKYVKRGNMLAIKKVLQEDVDIDYKDEMGFTALMYASIAGNLDIVKMLVQKGANLNIKNNGGLTALELAKFNGNRNEYQYLSKYVKESTEYFKMGDLKFDEYNKYTPFEILKSVIYCENPVTGGELVNSIDKDINLYSDYRIQIIMAYVALTILGNKDAHKLEIFISNDNNLISITGNPFFGELKGLINTKKNIIQITSGGEFAHTTRMLLHELIHKIHNTLPNKDMEKLKKYSKRFKAMAYLVKTKASKDWLKKNIIARIDEQDYENEDAKLEEIIADMGNAIIYANGLKQVLMGNVAKKLNKINEGRLNDNLQKEILYNKNIAMDGMLQNIENTSKDIMLAIKPIQDYFDTVMLPQMANYIIKNPYLKNLHISDELKVHLRQFKHMNMNNSNICINNTPEKNRDRTNMFF